MFSNMFRDFDNAKRSQWLFWLAADEPERIARQNRQARQELTLFHLLNSETLQMKGRRPVSRANSNVVKMVTSKSDSHRNASL